MQNEPPTKPLSEKLLQAVAYNDVPMLKKLHEAGESFANRNKIGETLLHWALRTQINGPTLDAFIYLLSLKEIPLDSLDSQQKSPIMYALEISSQDYAIQLIEAGCRIDELYCRRKKVTTVLHTAVLNNWTAVVESIIERGCDLDCQNSEGETPVRIACEQGFLDIVWMLLFYGADPNFTHVTESEYHGNYTLENCFDIAAQMPGSVIQDLFFCSFKGNKTLSLLTFIRGEEPEILHRLLDITDDFNYIYDDLKELVESIQIIYPKPFKLFVRDYSHILEDAFVRGCLNQVHIYSGDCCALVLAENIFTILESDIADSFVCALNSSSLPQLQYMVESFAPTSDSLEILTQIICALLSYGATVTSQVLNAVYFNYGYCELFRVMLHMDIGNMDESWPSYIMPQLIYDMNIRLDSVVQADDYDESTVHEMSKYFALRKVGPQISVPSLVELARNTTREHIIEKFQITTSRQFYTLLKVSSLADVHKKILAFEKQLYF